MDKKAQYQIPGWLLFVILGVIILGIVLFFLLGPYRANVSDFVQANIVGPIS